MHECQPGDLVPAAQSFRHFFDKQLRWRVKLPKRPSQSLEYKFYRPFDEAKPRQDGIESGNGRDAKFDIESTNATIFNAEETKVYPSKGLGYDNRVTVEMTVREDGTATPRFIYQVGDPKRDIVEHARPARPFFIDMTTSTSSSRLANYVGFDFGSSNSSICCLSNDVIESTSAKNLSAAWRGMAQALNHLPFPASFGVQVYLSCHDSSSVFDAALAAYEGCLGTLAYSMASEAIQLRPELARRLLKGFQHRSLGPLRALLAESARELNQIGHFFSGSLVDGEVLDEIDKAIRNFTNVKHHKAKTTEFKWHEHLEFLVRILVKAFEGLLFGYCATSAPERMRLSRHQGVFVVGHGSKPFVVHRQYSSKTAISRAAALIVDSERSRAICATPLFLWMDGGAAGDQSCYLIDDFDARGKTLLKASDRKEVVEASDLDPAVVPLIEKLRQSGEFFLGEVEFVLTPEDDRSEWG